MSKHFELLQQLGKEQNLFRTPETLSAKVEAAHYEGGSVEIAVPKVEPRKSMNQIRWPKLVKEKTKKWSQEVLRTKAPLRSEWGKVRRREELKLMQRIFPAAGAIGAQRVPQIVIFSGVEHGHAASMICARSSEILAERRDGPVCAVDAYFESPLLHRYFGVGNDKGLSESLCDSSPMNEFVHKTNSSNLWVLPTGSAKAEVALSPGEISERLKERLIELRTLFKYVVIHSPLYSDRGAAPPSFGADGLVLIIEANSTRRETMREVMEELRIQGTPVLGVVLNNRTFPIPDAIYHKI